MTRDFYLKAAAAKASDAAVLLDAAKPVEDVTEILAQGHVDIYKAWRTSFLGPTWSTDLVIAR